MGNAQEQLIDKTLLCLKHSNYEATTITFLWMCSDLMIYNHPRHYSRPTREWLLHNAEIFDDESQNHFVLMRRKLLWTLAEGVYSFVLKQEAKYSNTNLWEFVLCSVKYGENLM